MALLLGEKLAYLRLQRNWTKTDLAQRLGVVKRSHVSNVEANRRPPSLQFVILVGNLFGVTTDYLLRDTIPAVDSSTHKIVPSIPQTTLPKQFGVKLRHLREQAGMSQVELAQQLGLAGHTHISFLERGRHEPSIDLIVALADLFGISTDYLLRDEIPMTKEKE